MSIEKYVILRVNYNLKNTATERRNIVPRKNLKEARQKAGMTQQQMADRLEIGLRHYQKIEYAEIGGSFEVWDALEDILGIHQRKLREISNNHLAPKENPQER